MPKNPPPNPAKVTDSRFASYQAKYGDESWELDSLDPAFMDDLIRQEVGAFRDEDQFERKQAKEHEDFCKNVRQNGQPK